MARVTALIRQVLCKHPVPSASDFLRLRCMPGVGVGVSVHCSVPKGGFGYGLQLENGYGGSRLEGLCLRRKSTYAKFRCEVGADGVGVDSGGGSEFVEWRRGGGRVHSLAEVHNSVVVEYGALVELGANVGKNARISAGCVVGPGVYVGEDTNLGYNVVLQNCSVGARCILHPGVCVGQDGFGFLENSRGEIVKKPQLLQVQIGDHVEIGANTCVDRGSWRDTLIGDYTKIDNLVQIGHNVVIGRGCMICGQVGIAGSATIGDYVVLGGKAGVSDHVTVTSRVRIAAKSGVLSDIEKPGDYAGFPAVPAREWRKQMVVLRRMGRPAVKESCKEAAGEEVSNAEVI